MTSSFVTMGETARPDWVRLIESLPPASVDIYHQWDYLQLYAGPGSTPLLFVFDSGSHTYASVYLLRTVTSICGHSLDQPIIDLESPHGYTGPIATTRDTRFLSAANQAFLEWCTDVGVTAEFVRFHPIYRNHELANSGMSVEYNRTTYSITMDRTKTPSRHFNSKGRNMVRRAINGGLDSQIVDHSVTMNEFRSLYAETMQRVGADPDYEMKGHYFERLAEFSPEHIQVIALSDDQGVHSMGVFLAKGQGMHYHLSASRGHQRVPGASNLLIHRAVELAISTERSWLHLGGGLLANGEDSLSRFKQSISDTQHNYFVGKQVHQPAVWERAQRMALLGCGDSFKSARLLGYHSCP